MHTEDKRNQFIELRALGFSYTKIAAEIGVAKRTLVEWNKQHADEIDHLQVAEREAIRERLVGSREEWIKRKFAHFERLDTEFARREFKYSPTESVFRMLVDQRESLEKDFFPESQKPSAGPTATGPATEAQ
jgi:hypothetical protein